MDMDVNVAHTLYILTTCIAHCKITTNSLFGMRRGLRLPSMRMYAFGHGSGGVSSRLNHAWHAML